MPPRYIYKNPFFNPKDPAPDSRSQYYTNEPPEEYKGYQIFHRVKSEFTPDANVFDIVKDGTCVGMYAGINGAKRRIDELTNPNPVL